MWALLLSFKTTDCLSELMNVTSLLAQSSNCTLKVSQIKVVTVTDDVVVCLDRERPVS